MSNNTVTPPIVRHDGYDEITLGDPSDHRGNAFLARIDGDDFWRLHLPDHDDDAASNAEQQNERARLAARAALTLLELNGTTLSASPRPKPNHPERVEDISLTALTALSAVRAEIDDLNNRSTGIFAKTVRDLEAVGLKPLVVSRFCVNAPAGTRVLIGESFTGTDSHFPSSHLHGVRAEGMRGWGPRIVHSMLFIDHGLYDVVLNDGERVLLVPADIDPSDEAFRRATARLRAALRHECLRARIRDYAVSVVDDGGHELYSGDLIGAARWLFGVENVTASEDLTAQYRAATEAAAA
ncbi:hypothetical protein B0I12_002944 [Microbacterium hydrothermale]|nr:hypothetical protein [Microbacterium hydrothermale]